MSGSPRRRYSPSPRGVASRSRSPPPYRRDARRYSPRGRSRSRSPLPYRRDTYSDRRGVEVVASNPGNNLYVTGLSTRVTEKDLDEYFSKEGKVLECRLVVDPRSHESRGFGFVTLETMEDAERCIKRLHHSNLEGRIITVEKARRSRARTPTPGKYLGSKSTGGGRSHGGGRRYEERDYRDEHYRGESYHRRSPRYSPYRRSPRYSPYRGEYDRSPYSPPPYRHRREYERSPQGYMRHR